MNNAFWSEGPTRLRDALKDRRAEIDSLYEAIEQAEEASEKLRLIDQLRDILKEHQSSQHEIDRSLFFVK